MDSRDNHQAQAAQRSTRAAMNTHTSSRTALRDTSPPRTPRTSASRSWKGKAPMRALTTHHLRQETFLDDLTPIDGSRGKDRDLEEERDTHDLSLTSGTRDSIVDNMLLSLDSLSHSNAPFDNAGTLYSRLNNDDFYASSTRYAPSKTSKHHDHTHVSSVASDYDPYADDNSSRIVSYHTRGRTNSSSNFHSALGTVDSIRNDGRASARTSSEMQRHRVPEEEHTSTHARRAGRKGSKSSGSSSLDFGYSQVIGTQRWGLGRRSASFDQSYDGRGSRKSPQKMLSSSMLERGRPSLMDYNNIDAAPTPTVPPGPRRLQASMSPVAPLPAQPTYAPPDASLPVRKSSIRPSTSKLTKKGKLEMQDAYIRSQAHDFVTATNLRELPPLPTPVDPPAPSPTVALRKATTPPSPAPIQNLPREKPGFFRRVFGSSKNHAPAHNDKSPLPSQPSSAGTQASAPLGHPNTQADQQQRATSQPMALPRLPAQEMRGETVSTLPERALTKKHSFFRRRKKSVTSNVRPPVVPSHYQPKIASLMAVPSSPSMSSLWRVMDPYLNDDASPAQAYFDSREHQTTTSDENGPGIVTGFSPGYTPHKDATVRAVKPGSRGTNATGSAPSSRNEALTSSQLVGMDSPKLKLKMKRDRTSPVKAHDDTFLADSSGNEDRSGGVSPVTRSPTFGLPDEQQRRKTSLTSLSAVQLPLRDKENLAPQGGADFGTMTTKLLKPEGQSQLPPDSTQSSVMADTEDDGWVVTTPTKAKAVRSVSNKPNRLWLDDISTHDNLDEPAPLSLPLEGARTLEKASPTAEQATPTSTSDVFQSATSLPLVQVDDRNVPGEEAVVDETAAVSTSQEVPTAEDRERAEKIFNGEEDFVSKAQAAAWLGGAGATSSRACKAYMELFDWTGCNIIASLRDLCSRLVLKGESQQLDRVIGAFSRRWCECNSNHGFRADDVIHTITYSLIMLNTDLYSDIEHKMTRTQYVKNTLPTIIKTALVAGPEPLEETVRAQGTHSGGTTSWPEPTSPGPNSPTFFPDGPDERPSLERKRSRNRLSIRPPARTDSDGPFPTLGSAPADNCNVLVNAPFEGPMKAWETQVEVVLKEFYNSIRQQRLPLHGAQTAQTPESQYNNALSAMAGSMLRRTPSVLSKAPSDALSYRGRAADLRSVTSRWGSKARSRPRLYPTSTVGSSRTSLDDQSLFSPSGSTTWSKYSLGKTQTSMSMESLGSHFAHGDYQQSIGFANALSQVIIREEGATLASSEEFSRVAPLLEDETLELAGAPWAKEGILKHKHHLESIDKKAKDRNWNQCFAVIEKGWMRLFSFNMNSKSLRLKSKSRSGGVVGGGNWVENAEAIGSFLLRQTIASAMPPPGYSKSRPHVWALSLPTGAVHLFQVGTPDIIKEFVSTANYWSARLSKEPLVGGVSNIEYGWSDNVINLALVHHDSTPSSGVVLSRSSLQSSIQGSIRSSAEHGSGTVRARLPGDRITLMDWTPPVQSMMASALMEVDQLKALTAYVKNVEDELARHNELRAPMMLAFSSRHPNSAKASANWEKKSAYLLREIVKFRTYIDSLNAAQAQKEKIYAERDAKEAEAEANAAAESNAPQAGGEAVLA